VAKSWGNEKDLEKDDKEKENTGGRGGILNCTRDLGSLDVSKSTEHLGVCVGGGTLDSLR